MPDEHTDNSADIRPVLRFLALRAFLVCVSLLLTTSSVAADVGELEGSCSSPLRRCSDSNGLDFDWQQSAFEGVDIDTGWLPQESNIQVRFGVRLLGNSEVSFDASVEAEWPEGMVIAGVDGAPDAGWLSVGYGLEITAQLKINVSVLGQSFSWTGDIPTPSQLPNDLLLAAEAQYTPWLLPGAEPSVVEASDVTGRITAFVIGLDDSIIDIPGIDGHLALQVEATLDANYRDLEVSLSDGGTIQDVNSTATLPVPTDGYGASIVSAVTPRGRLAYKAGLILHPNLRIKILGITVIDQDLFSLPISIPNIESSVDFEAKNAEIPLPDLRVLSEPLIISDTNATATLSIENQGQEWLYLEVEWPMELSAQPELLQIAPDDTLHIDLTLSPELHEGGVSVVRQLVLQTNDPDMRQITLPLQIEIAGTDVEFNPAEGENAGCGCQSGGGTSSGFALLFFSLLALSFKKRRGC